MNPNLSLYRRVFILFLFTGIFSISFAQDTMIFTHPGAMNSQEDLDFVKEKIAAGQQPWMKAYWDVKYWAQAGTNAVDYINSSDNSEAGPGRDDSWKAYANALMWHFTEEEIYAQQAVIMLNAWSDFQGFNAGNDQDKLQAGWMGAIFGPAAELMREYSGWEAEDRAKVQEMFKRAYYPQLLTASTWNGNVDLTQIDALMSIAVFNEDEDSFNAGLERLRLRNPAYFYLASDPASSRSYGGSSYPGSWFGPSQIVDGLNQEMCRDNNHHAQFAMASALHAAEVAWNQGVDVYTENTERYTATMELMAEQILSGEMQGTCSNNATTVEYIGTWEVGYNHYHNRKEVEMPYTAQLIKDHIRSKSWSALNIFYETLTHAHNTTFVIASAKAQITQIPVITIYPNPSDDGLFKLSKEIEWQAYNITGSVVREGFGTRVDLSDQASGLYLVKANNKVIKAIIR